MIETVKESANSIILISKKKLIQKIGKISYIKVKTKGSLFGNEKAFDKIAKILSDM